MVWDVERPRPTTQESLTTDRRYEGGAHPPTPTLVTSRGSGHVGRAQLAAWCDRVVCPFWLVVREGLLEALATRSIRGDAQYGAADIVASAVDVLRRKGHIFYAHHLLYNFIGGVKYPPCDPSQFGVKLPPPPPAVPWKRRFFEDSNTRTPH